MGHSGPSNIPFKVYSNPDENAANSQLPRSEDTQNTNEPAASTQQDGDRPTKNGSQLSLSLTEENLSSNEGWKNERNDEDEKNELGRIAPEVYEGLPSILSEIVDQIDPGHERDVFLTGALPVVAGALPNVQFKYGGQWLSLNLYTAVIAPAGAGKGKMRHARKMAAGLNKKLHAQSRKRRSNWENRKESKEEDPGPKPSYRRFYLPADNSAASMKDGLADSPNAVIFETEFKTLSTTLSQDWGKFRDILLKGFQNEPVEVDRKTEDPLLIEHPAPSMAVSGTPRTFAEVIGDMEDGLFSRFAFYQFDAEPVWRSQFGEIEESGLEEALSDAADTLEALYKELDSRAEPLYITFEDEAIHAVDEVSSFVLDHWAHEGVNRELHSSLKRAALRAVRISAMMRVLRHFEKNGDLSSLTSLEVGLKDIEVGLRLAFTYLVHSLLIAANFSSEESRSSLTRKQREFLDALPNGEFETTHAKQVARDVGVNERTAQSWLKQWAEETSLVDKVKYGVWVKPHSSPRGKKVAGLIPLISVIPVIFDTKSPQEGDIHAPEKNGAVSDGTQNGSEVTAGVSR